MKTGRQHHCELFMTSRVERGVWRAGVPSCLFDSKEAAVKRATKHTRMSSKGNAKAQDGGTVQVPLQGRLARRGATALVEDSRPARRGSSDCIQTT
jgi:hypothetical protein